MPALTSQLRLAPATLLATTLVASAATATPLPSPRELAHIHEDGVWDVEYSDDGTLLATAGGDGRVRIFDTVTLAEVSSATQSDDGFQVYDVHFLPGGDRVVAAALGGKPKVFETRTGKLLKVLEGHEENVVRLEHSREGTLLYTAGSDDTVIAWDARDYRIVGRYRTKSPVAVVALERTGKVLVASLDGVVIADVIAGTTLATVNDSPYYFAAAGVIGRRAFTGGQVAEGASPVPVDLETNTFGSALQGFSEGFIWNMAANPARGLVAASSYKGPVVVWDVPTARARPLPALARAESLSVAFSPDGSELAIGDTEGSVRLEPMH
jgi:WD40 repeat protein